MWPANSSCPTAAARDQFAEELSGSTSSQDRFPTGFVVKNRSRNEGCRFRLAVRPARFQKLGFGVAPDQFVTQSNKPTENAGARLDRQPCVIVNPPAEESPHPTIGIGICSRAQVTLQKSSFSLCPFE